MHRGSAADAAPLSPADAQQPTVAVVGRFAVLVIAMAALPLQMGPSLKRPTSPPRALGRTVLRFRSTRTVTGALRPLRSRTETTRRLRSDCGVGHHGGSRHDLALRFGNRKPTSRSYDLKRLMMIGVTIAVFLLVADLAAAFGSPERTYSCPQGGTVRATSRGLANRECNRLRQISRQPSTSTTTTTSTSTTSSSTLSTYSCSDGGTVRARSRSRRAANAECRRLAAPRPGSLQEYIICRRPSAAGGGTYPFRMTRANCIEAQRRDNEEARRRNERNNLHEDECAVGASTCTDPPPSSIPRGRPSAERMSPPPRTCGRTSTLPYSYIPGCGNQ